jgi:hypothetical protein
LSGGQWIKDKKWGGDGIAFYLKHIKAN